MVFGVGGSNSAITGSIKSKMVAGCHLGMMALSRVTLVSAGLSCLKKVKGLVHRVYSYGTSSAIYGITHLPPDTSDCTPP